ncbi:MAG TPA: metalloregulator ArsR/SmtB family transcription factor [Polyangiaceae bacterium]|nr:metalloregulator ArsR/SmtB family transcription factor [Polyangiaceae bacterium]
MVHAAAPHQGARRLSQERLNRAFAALADPTRRAAVELLRRGPRRAGELAEQLGSTPAGLSRHLRVLRESGLIGEYVLEQDGRVRLLYLEREPFHALRCWVEDVEEFWTGQLASFKAHAERTRARRGRT